MSVEAVKWAMDDAPMLLTEKGRPDTTARFVLSALAEHAHVDGTNSYPSVPRIQYKTGFNRRTVQDALGRLEAAGLITAMGTKHSCTNWTLSLRRKRPAADWEQLSDETEKRRAATAERVRRHRARQVTPSDGVTETPLNSVTGNGVTPSDAEVTPSNEIRNAVEQRSVTPSDAPEPPAQPSGEPPEEPSLFAAPPQAERETPRAAAPAPVSDGFDAFWAEYPRKAAKADARKAYASAIKAGVDSGQLVTAAIKHREHWTAEGRQSGYVPYPATWLRKGSYEDELQPSRPSSSHQAYRNPIDQSAYEKDI
ncbi:helix-turn-helix protein [Streptomyces sp. 846.5]|nr:helix-turn-helix domain-containing protein [Streptomyces sp. 846.5]TDT95338.1 helix-turn-helix protein [Streptomyces sp. 846.5]